MKAKLFFLVIILAVLCICSIAFAQEPPGHEEITLTTYYPAPYGEYNSLSVGDPGNGYLASVDGQLLVEGNVGIGTTAPVAKLETTLAASGHVPMLYSGNTWPQFPRTIQNVSASITTNDTTVATGPVIGLNLENSSQTNNTYSPLITFSRHSVTNDYNSIYASIGGICTGNGGDTNWTAGDLVFGTTNSNGPLERMRILANGNVGIGTTEPGAKLDVQGNLRVGQYTLPSVDGQPGQVLSTDGNGNLNWVDMGGGGFGDWVDLTSSFSWGTDYGPVATDGFIALWARGYHGGGGAIGYTDSNSSPTTKVTGEGAGYVDYSHGIMMPVKKGHYWKISRTHAGYGNSEVYVRWIPLGD